MSTKDTAIIAVSMAIAGKYLLACGEDIADLWAEYPDIGENDWIRICDAVEHLAGELITPDEELLRAYHVLAARAEGSRA